MAMVDPAIKIFAMDTTTLIWDMDSPIDNADFVQENGRMREQVFCRGSQKVTLFFSVESKYTMNRIKYTELVKEYIFLHNIWIKPEFYSSQVVSCPGFLTLVHPKFTHKGDLSNKLAVALQGIRINETEQVVQEWYQGRGSEVNADTHGVPKFHLETSSRKWGGIQTDVLSVHCPTEDAQYLKYLFAETSTQTKLPQGLFVPTGIHLMEGKEVMTHLLKEQQEFIDQVTSVQIGGISNMDMHNPTQNESIYQQLTQVEGVHAIEKLYHTEVSSQWSVVMDKQKIQGLVSYITDNLETLN